jgi:hypothetical protein
MARIQCRYLQCIHLDDGYCSALLVQLDPEEGCITYSQGSIESLDDDWNDDEDFLDWEKENLDNWYEDDDDKLDNDEF